MLKTGGTEVHNPRVSATRSIVLASALWLSLAATASAQQTSKSSLQTHLWRGEFSLASDVVEKTPRLIAMRPMLYELVKAERLLAEKRPAAARSYLLRAKDDPYLKEVATFWVCMSYQLEARAADAEDCFKTERMNPNLAESRIATFASAPAAPSKKKPVADDDDPPGSAIKTSFTKP